MTEKLAALIETTRKYKALAEKCDHEAHAVVGIARAIYDADILAGKQIDSFLATALADFDHAKAARDAYRESEEYKQAHR
jgi:hypothetical protein